ncbi:MAG: DUF427 domain-containing protein [Ilumatobacter sp.]|uniref:DUF427 domain-containing protein n=1 Tax=Ilumatobacter sp. TaxID=1967498 RepID=UPI0026390993|nr:DUF427 domain-containing protein [Ilumatobacter sp.]MDJ0767921.1 DUF427 domain-containing protein [Ilumatobacter sp.]
MAATRPRVRVEPNPKWIRGVLAGATVVDSRRARYVWEIPYYPAWYFPVDDVAAELVENGETVRSPSRGIGTRYDLHVDGRVLANAAWRHVDSPVEELRDLVRIEWDAVDAWFEEDVEVFVHPRSPEVRVDTLASSRHVRVSIDGTVVAETRRPTVLYETGLPPRYYIPKSDVRMELLSPTDTSTACPYKGWANYWTVTVGGNEHVDVAWGYRTPLPESEPIAGLVCFYDERVDVELDGQPTERPRTKFS